MDENRPKMPHTVILENRKSMTISGVEDVDSFDEQTIIIYTDLGELTVRGSDLHINRLSIEIGELALEGNIESLAYTDNQPKQTGFFSKVFR